MMTLHPATSADLDLLRYWDEQFQAIVSDSNDDWNWEVELKSVDDQL
jgi:aminoglycoside 6'-N-acetyltransferase